MKLIIPENILDQHMVVLGKTGAGKSSALRHIVEHLLQHNKRVCVVDPKGDWSGLKWSADGKHEGFPVIGFGDFKEPKGQDIPLNVHAGKHVAELITSGNRPCIIGFRGWMPGQMTKFWLDFAPTLFNSNAGELYLIIDEVHNFAAKGKIMDPEAGKCLHWSNRLMAEGRGVGLVCLIASQRPQKVHNDTLTCCETLVAMRVNHAADRGAIKDWIDGCGDPEQGKAVLAELAAMKRGEAYVWSPEAGFGPKRLTFPMFETFDSFAPPQLQKKVVAAGWSSVDLGEVKQKLAVVIEEQKANDPAELKRTIADLRRKLADAERKAPEVKQERVEVSILTDEDRRALERAYSSASELVTKIESETSHLWSHIGNVQSFMAKVEERLNRISPVKNLPQMLLPVKPKLVNQTRKPSQNVNHANGDPSFTRTQQRILDALAWFSSIGNDNPTTIQVGVVACIDATGGHFSNTIGPLSSAGFVERGNGTLALTPSGAARANCPDHISTLDDYHDMLRKRVLKARSAGGKTVEILNAIIARGGDEITIEEIGQAVGIDHTGGHFSNMIGPLGGLGLIERRAGIVRPTETLFPPTMR